MDEPIRITAQPADSRHCRFILDAPQSGGPRRFASAQEAAGSPLAEALFDVPGIREVVVMGGTITLTKDTSTPWQAVGQAVGAAIRRALALGVPPLAPAAPAADAASDERLYSQVADLFEREINPAVARHGGEVELIDVQDATVVLRMGGGCQGCGMADVTLRQGVEALLRERVPEIKALVDVTDHAAGTNPYVTASKK
jgi:Fe-S cluster biogenesis protein NfuA